MYPDHRVNYFAGLTLEVTNERLLFNNKTLSDSDLAVEPGAARYLSQTSNLTVTSFANRTVALRGYLQSWKYFDEFRDEIRATFTFKEHTLEAAKKAILAGLSKLENTTALKGHSKLPTLVGIHVRRGDILQEPHKSGGQVPASEEYLLRAALRYQRKYFPVMFIVISNDIEYCRRLFLDSNFLFITDTSLEVDMAIMTLVDEMVMSVGSYSWWGAYLNEQATDVSYFKDWPRNGSAFGNALSATDYFLPSWHARI